VEYVSYWREKAIRDKRGDKMRETGIRDKRGGIRDERNEKREARARIEKREQE
jgi:hypothetical protein